MLHFGDHGVAAMRGHRRARNAVAVGRDARRRRAARARPRRGARRFAGEDRAPRGLAVIRGPSGRRERVMPAPGAPRAAAAAVDRGHAAFPTPSARSRARPADVERAAGVHQRPCRAEDRSRRAERRSIAAALCAMSPPVSVSGRRARGRSLRASASKRRIAPRRTSATRSRRSVVISSSPSPWTTSAWSQPRAASTAAWDSTRAARARRGPGARARRVDQRAEQVEHACARPARAAPA